MDNDEYTLAPDLTDHESIVLKKNKYKCVRLLIAPDGHRSIAKSYSGHNPEHLQANTRYVQRTLDFFCTTFDGILRTPKPLSTDADSNEIRMEYLDQLDQAALLNRRTLERAEDFFEQCYAIRDDQGFLRHIRESVYYVPAVKALIESRFPVALGLKGDLWQNLCLFKDTLILADIDSAALEPLGLSELIIFAEIGATTDPKFFSLKSMPATPVCFRHITRMEAAQLIDAALAIQNLRMSHLNTPFRILKSTLARSVLQRAIVKHYDKPSL